MHVVSAYDQDRQLNYPIMYGIQSVALENDTILDTNLFSINSTTGEVITNHGLNYETVAKYIITVQVSGSLYVGLYVHMCVLSVYLSFCVCTYCMCLCEC